MPLVVKDAFADLLEEPLRGVDLAEVDFLVREDEEVEPVLNSLRIFW